MSFLSILLVASAFYFAHARPDSQSWSEAPSGGEVEHPPEYSVPITFPKDYQHKLFSFLKDVEETLDQHITPLMSKLDVKKQDELKSMCMNGFRSYINYLMLLIEEIINAKDKVYDQFHGDSLPRDEILIQFESYSLDPSAPYLAATQDEDEEGEHGE